MAGSSRVGWRLTAARLEYVSAVGLVAAVGWVAAQAWAFYDAQLRPDPLPATALPPERPPSVRADNPAEIRRWQKVLDGLGEAATYLAAKRPEWAAEALQRVLELDPGNRDALALLAEMAIEPAPTLTPNEGAGRQREARLAALLGAAASLADAGRPAAARALLEQALALDSTNAAAQAALARLVGG